MKSALLCIPLKQRCLKPYWDRSFRVNGGHGRTGAVSPIFLILCLSRASLDVIVPFDFLSHPPLCHCHILIHPSCWIWAYLSVPTNLSERKGWTSHLENAWMWIWSRRDFLCSEHISCAWWMLKGDTIAVIAVHLTYTFVEQIVSLLSVYPFVPLDVFKMSEFLVNTSECLSPKQF